MRSIKRLGVVLVAGAAAFSLAGAPAQASDTVDIAGKTLSGYKHVGQDTGYWCGPASAYILITGMKAHGKIKTTKSKSGLKLTQKNLASDTYLGANGGGGTQRADMRDGINKWIGHKWYKVHSNPTPAEFKDRLLRAIPSGRGVAVAAYESAGKRHYNGHPKGKTIDHWVVARGYTTNLSKTNFVDPATTVWSGVKPYFSHYTNSFVNVFVRPSKAIVW
ncbi:C39 family peptidase [Tenggerimyces flavus]|uniref:C39 family peptidase n=1 Tax=Tenggerimyces flavus TaxID=1708749 RepID=A0ABV7YJG5_9ACTN|nr:C39 family peptidase [Tenggerimyces flavus]MBM7789709.1 hypothetical protein [Tenggerimyces flavus]